jgi:hypothetical protein
LSRHHSHPCPMVALAVRRSGQGRDHQRRCGRCAPFGAWWWDAAEKRDLAKSIAELREMADGRDDILAEAAGITAGSWYASPATHVGYELIGAGMLIVAGDGRGLPMDYDELARWTRVGFERGMAMRRGER